MSYTLIQLADDIRAALRADPSTTGKDAVRRYVSRALTDAEFVATHLRDRTDGAPPREVLYEDPDLGFCICGHVYSGAAETGPHDHGPSWAIYGQAAGVTEMTDWRIVEAGSGDRPSLVEPVAVYALQPGDAHFYDVGAVHSPRRTAATKLLRIEGANLDRIKRSNIKAK